MSVTPRGLALTDQQRESIMSQEIFDVGGGLYLTLPDPVPSRGDLEGWMVRQVSSAHRTPGRVEWDGTRWTPVTWVPGTIGLTSADVDSFNGVLRVVGELSADYGYRGVSSRVGVDSFRWTWERWDANGTHQSDMIIVSRIH